MVRVFVSYSNRDRGFVEQLVHDLQENGINPWYDRWEMLPGDSLMQKIGDAILENEYLVVVLSPNSAESEWVKRELGLALTREFRERRVQVIPALLQDCSIPAFLQDKVYADFRSDYHQGLGELVRAVGLQVGSQVKSSAPGAAQRRMWDNVIGSNVTAENVIEANVHE